MFVGNFYIVSTKEEIDKRIGMGTPLSIIFVETEKKLYSKNAYGTISDYPGTEINIDKKIDFFDEISDIENRLFNLENKFNDMTNK